MARKESLNQYGPLDQSVNLGYTANKGRNKPVNYVYKVWR